VGLEGMALEGSVEDVCLPGLGSVEGKGGLEEAKVEGKGEGSEEEEEEEAQAEEMG